MDYALPFRRALIAEAQGRPLTDEQQALRIRTRLASKRAAAVASLGDSWVMHLDYRPELHPHHRPSHKNSAVLKAVADNARANGRLV